MTIHQEKTKILVLLGSPRKGANSTLLAERLAEGAMSQGAEVEVLSLQALNLSPCRSCYACQKRGSKGCAIDDGMQDLYPKLLQSPVWVIASPVYWFNMSAQTKIFMDRCFALPTYAKDAFKGKRIAIVMTYGDKDPFASGCVNALRSFQDAYRYVGAEIVGMVYGSALNAGDIRTNEEVMKEAEALGRRLVNPEA